MTIRQHGICGSEIAREVLSAINDQLPDKIRYLLSRLVKETADELKELIRKYADDLLQGFVPYHERT